MLPPVVPYRTLRLHDNHARYWHCYGLLRCKGLPFFTTFPGAQGESKNGAIAKQAFGIHKQLGTYGKFLLPIHWCRRFARCPVSVFRFSSLYVHYAASDDADSRCCPFCSILFVCFLQRPANFSTHQPFRLKHLVFVLYAGIHQESFLPPGKHAAIITTFIDYHLYMHTEIR